MTEHYSYYLFLQSVSFFFGGGGGGGVVNYRDFGVSVLRLSKNTPPPFTLFPEERNIVESNDSDVLIFITNKNV